MFRVAESHPITPQTASKHHQLGQLFTCILENKPLGGSKGTLSTLRKCITTF